MTKDPESFKVGVKSSVHHGDLLKARLERGWTNKQMAEYLGISSSHMGRLLNLKEIPNPKNANRCGKIFTEEVQKKLLELTGKTVDQLWPEHLHPIQVNVVHTFKDVDPLLLESGHERSYLPEYTERRMSREEIEPYLSRLSWRREQAIRLRFFEDMTLDQVADRVGFSRERVRQVIQDALRQLRQMKIKEAISAPHKYQTRKCPKCEMDEMYIEGSWIHDNHDNKCVFSPKIVLKRMQDHIRKREKEENQRR